MRTCAVGIEEKECDEQNKASGKWDEVFLAARTERPHDNGRQYPVQQKSMFFLYLYFFGGTCENPQRNCVAATPSFSGSGFGIAPVESLKPPPKPSSGGGARG